MYTQASVNMAILKKFAEKNINMPYPTEHLLLTNLDKAAANLPAAKEESGNWDHGRKSRWPSGYFRSA